MLMHAAASTTKSDTVNRVLICIPAYSFVVLYDPQARQWIVTL